MEIQALNLLTEGSVPDDADCLFIDSPSTDISEDEKTAIIDYLENGFKEFLLDDSGDELTKEYLLPIIVDQLIKTNRASVKVLETTDKWFGVTYPEDKQIVQDSINELIEQGIYPEKLWK